MDNADTTTTGRSGSLFRIISIVREIAAQSATDVPPNFITIIFQFVLESVLKSFQNSFLLLSTITFPPSRTLFMKGER